MTKEDPWEVIKRNMERPMGVKINCFYTRAAGSDFKTISLIEKAITNKQAFALGCESSKVFYFPEKLKAYWVGGTEAEFQYADMKSFIDGVKMQYLSHKDFISPMELLNVSIKMNRLENKKELNAP